MKHYYFAPAAWHDPNDPAFNPPKGIWRATATPGDPTTAIVVVESWNSPTEQDAWEAQVGVLEQFPENFGAQATPNVIAMFAPWGAKGGYTFRRLLHDHIRPNSPDIR